MALFVSPSLFRCPFSKLWAVLHFLAMGSPSLWAEGLPADTRLRELHLERSNHSARPLPANISFADVIGNDIEVFDNDNDTHKEGTHAFFIQLGDKTALALGYEHQHGGKEPSEIRFKGQLLKLGPLLRSPPNAAHSMMWVWEADLPPGAVPLVREKLALPLIMYQDEMTILTAEGPKQAELTSMHPARSVLPGQAIGDGAKLKLDEADSYKAIRVGDPVIQTRTGIVVAAVGSKEPWIPSMKEPADIGIVWLSFPRPQEPLNDPLVEVWGASVPSHPSLDEAFVQKLMPARALGTRIGETIEEAWERNPLLHRLPPEAKDRHFSEDYFGEEWVFNDQKTAVKDGRVVRIDYETACSIGTKTTMAYVNWLAEKFQQPKEVRKTPRGNALMAIWNQGPVWVAAMFNLSDKTISLDMFVAVSEAELKDRFNEDAFSVPAAADKATFLSLAGALASQAQPEDFGIPEKLPLSNPMVMASADKTVMKRNGQDITAEEPAKPVIAQKTEEPPQLTLAPPPSSKMKEEIRSMAVQRIETLGRVVQAYNAMPANVREAARVQNVAGAFGLLRTHAERYPDLPLNDDLRDTMEWALVFLDTGKLQGSPALQKLAQVINAEIALEKAQRIAQEAATAFAAAKKAGSKELDKLKTIEDILQRLNAGVKGTGTSKSTVFTAQSTPKQAAQVVPHLRYDAPHQTLRYVPKSVKLEGSDVPLEGIEALAQLIKQMPEARLATQAPITPSNTADDMAGRRNAQSLCSIFAAAQATGSTEFAHLKTVEAVIHRLNAGVKGGQALGGAFKDKTFIMKTTPEETAAAKRHLKWDLAEHTLIYNPEGMTPAEFHRKLNAQQANLPPTSPSEVSDAQAQRTAQRLASIYDAAVATGSKDIDQLQTLDAVINRLTTTGLIGGPGPFEGKRMYAKTKPGEAEAAKPYLRYDSFTKTLRYSATPIGGSRGSSTALSGHETRPQSMQVGSETRHRTFSLDGDSASSPDRARRNAEIICTVFNMAVASGAEKVQDVTTVDRAVQLIMTGVYGGGVFREVRFSVDGTPEKAAAAKPFLTYDRNSRSLRYVANARPTPAANETRPTVMNVGRAVGGGVTFAGRTFANTAEMEKAIRESHEAAKQAVAVRNAQAFVSTYNAAMAAGAKELDDVRSADQALKLIVAGVNGGGPFKDRLFVVDATPEEAAGVRPYIEFDPRQQILIYKSPYR